MSAKIFIFATIIALLALPEFAQAQQAKKIPLIGYLSAADRSALSSARAEAFRQGLREVGYVEGKTFSSSGDMWRLNPNLLIRSLPTSCA